MTADSGQTFLTFQDYGRELGKYARRVMQDDYYAEFPDLLTQQANRMTSDLLRGLCSAVTGQKIPDVTHATVAAMQENTTHLSPTEQQKAAAFMDRVNQAAAHRNGNDPDAERYEAEYQAYLGEAQKRGSLVFNAASGPAPR